MITARFRSLLVEPPREVLQVVDSRYGTRLQVVEAPPKGRISVIDVRTNATTELGIEAAEALVEVLNYLIAKSREAKL